MSTWTMVAFLANSSNLPVTRSSKRTPKARSRSAPSWSPDHRVVGGLAGLELAVDRPVGEGGAVHAEPAERERVFLGKPPMPMIVVVTGIPAAMANFAVRRPRRR
jgi:hypothetical protein